MTTEPTGYRVLVETPAVEVYRDLRRRSGLSDRSPEAARIGLLNTWHAVTVRHGEETVGMGRAIGDGGCFFQIVDICVLPEHQGRGLAKRIMAGLVSELETRAPKGAYVSLIADGDARFLYQKFGFVPTAPASVGMYRFV